MGPTHRADFGAATHPGVGDGTHRRLAIDSPYECEHNNPDSLDARLFFTVVLAVAPAVTMDEASSLSLATFERCCV